MLEKAKQYFTTYLSSQEKCLLALSGGPDSMALFIFLLEQKIPFDVCHINHKIRKESDQEQKELACLCDKHNISFHTCNLEEASSIDIDKENWMREKRYAFFHQIYQQTPYQALLTAHHRDDQIETILKRVFEGSSFLHYGGIKDVSMHKNMKILRPFLQESKKDLLSYLSKNQQDFFVDFTNEDLSFLRNRMRHQLLPFLEKTFGKGLGANILALGKYATDCHRYFTRKNAYWEKKLQQGLMGWYLPLVSEVDSLELEFFLRYMIKDKMQCVPTRGDTEKILHLVSEKKSGKKVPIDVWEVIYENDTLFFFDTKIKLLTLKSLCTILSKNQNEKHSWRTIWSQKEHKTSKNMFADLRLPQLQDRLPNGKRLKDWYAEHKVPAFLRKWFPVDYKEGKLHQEFLTGF